MMNLNPIESFIERHFNYYDIANDIDTMSNFEEIYKHLSNNIKLRGVEYSFLCWLNYCFGWELKINVPKIPYIKELDIMAFKKEFVSNAHRLNFFNELENFVRIKKEKNNIAGNVLIGGSFVDIENETPNDIDVIFLIPPEYIDKCEFNGSDEYATEVFNNKRSKNLDLIYLPIDYDLKKFRAYTYITAYGNKATIKEKDITRIEGVVNNVFNEIELIKISI